MNLRSAITGLSLCLGASALHAQSQVTIYGILDATVRYSTHENADGDSKLQVGDGMLTGSRLGFRGVEDLGGGLKAKFNIESGISPDTGTVGQGGRMWGRQSFVGLEGDFGEVRLGRQYAVAHEIGAGMDAMAFANLGLLGYEGQQYTGLRFDNMVRYSKRVGGFTAVLGYAFGEVAGNSKRNASAGLGGTYESGPLKVGAVYQKTNSVATYFGTPSPPSQQTWWSLGGTYLLGGTKLFFAYGQNRLEEAALRNRVVSAGIHYPVTDSVRIVGNVIHDRMRSAGESGRRLSSAVMFDYLLSKRTDVYLGVDYTRVQGTWLDVATRAGFPTPFFDGQGDRTGLMVGLRNVF